MLINAFLIIGTLAAAAIVTDYVVRLLWNLIVDIRTRGFRRWGRWTILLLLTVAFQAGWVLFHSDNTEVTEAGPFLLTAQATLWHGIQWRNEISDGLSVRTLKARRRYIERLWSYIVIGMASFYFGLFSILISLWTDLYRYRAKLLTWSHFEQLRHLANYVERQDHNIAILSIGIALFAAVDALILTSGDIDASAAESLAEITRRLEDIQRHLVGFANNQQPRRPSWWRRFYR